MPLLRLFGADGREAEGLSRVGVRARIEVARTDHHAEAGDRDEERGAEAAVSVLPRSARHLAWRRSSAHSMAVVAVCLTMPSPPAKRHWIGSKTYLLAHVSAQAILSPLRTIAEPMDAQRAIDRRRERVIRDSLTPPAPTKER
ncbi:hypothetical protein GCM10012280_30740 [Wenjunlia tyrosinilytica]|uniref:Uncharacterized protein n=1 Tax=Wenjunlia tyrosinilytica TaxID=1544741 RepID=A0A917ZQJ7_9ACTN|nr:hypothetical protein GCM10012280_30740 [Wenjunlia tyrosinilytica]